MHRFGWQCSAADTAERWRDANHHDWQVSRPLSITLLTRPQLFHSQNRACGNSGQLCLFFFSSFTGPWRRLGPGEIEISRTRPENTSVHWKTANGQLLNSLSAFSLYYSINVYFSLVMTSFNLAELLLVSITLKWLKKSYVLVKNNNTPSPDSHRFLVDF